ncbi:response regulator [Flaviaesturariibacter flavus]|uniref:Response regulator n=1 Tax=Flaviaesturariibacter flavus TaxID=2502780 RepID=A0A4R1BPT8_9BACT|nr:response regulator [Flaviaesturariibacter flavus]TCJ19347.1 response regulator [Flaviaesturariibacter flavus]
MKTYRIILVENDDDEQLFMKDSFQRAGVFELLTVASNGEELLEWISKNSTRPDLVLTDLNMPGMNGMDILGAFRDDPRLRGIPVVITSTSSTPSIIDKCMDAGAANYMVKPDTFIQYDPFVKELYQFMKRREGQPGTTTS